jgi:Cu/Ag efflux protein CusF
MRKALTIILSILLVVSIAGAAIAKEKTRVKQITGEVLAVDPAAKTITVKGRKAEVTLTADEKALLDIKLGDRVVVKYTEQDGKSAVKSIKKAAEKDGKKGEEKKAEPAKK